MTDIGALVVKLQALRDGTDHKPRDLDNLLDAAKAGASLLCRHEGLAQPDYLATPFQLMPVALGDQRRTPLWELWPCVAQFCDCTGFFNQSGPFALDYVYFGRGGDSLVANYVHAIVSQALIEAMNALVESDDYRKRRSRGAQFRARKALISQWVKDINWSLGEALWGRYREAYGIADPSNLIKANAETCIAKMREAIPQ